MRLLRLDEYGDLSLTEWAEKEVPPYAILSHRWGRDEEEVSFKDLMEDGGRNKKGYRKLLSCGNQAMKDGYVFFWVDTCCIDKSSSAELSESINSMWRWYRDSHVCYAYLDDVPARVSARQKDFSFTMSKWFTRGWTLQELLAPSKLMLFDAGWAPMGTKDELADKISRITKIDDSYLRGAGDFLIQATIAEKMSWAAKRQTKRSEDIAYCLLGLFDINMPLLYGEGQNAFRRLQEEIMKESDDHSILAWGTEPENRIRQEISVTQDLSVQPVPHHALVTGGGGLAPSPAYFKNYGDIVRSIGPGPVKPYAKTNRGLHIELPLLKQSGQVLALLNCRRKYDLFSDLALHLSKSADGEDQYWRASGHIDVVSTAFRSRAVLQPIYIKTGTDSADLRSDPNNGSCVIRNLLYTHNVSRVFPPWSWSPQTNSFADDTELSDEGWPSPRLVISASRVTPRTTDQLAFMVFKRRHLWGVTWDARFVPLESKAEDDLQELYRHWKFADLSELPRCQKLHSNTVALRITPLSVRSRHIVALDMISHEEQNPEALENSERWKFFVRCTKYHYVRLITTHPAWASALLSYIGGLLLDKVLGHWWNPKLQLEFVGPMNKAYYDKSVPILPSSFILVWVAIWIIRNSPLGMWFYQGLMHVWWYDGTSDPRAWDRRWVPREAGPIFCLWNLAHYSIFGSLPNPLPVELGTFSAYLHKACTLGMVISTLVGLYANSQPKEQIRRIDPTIPSTQAQKKG